MNDFKRPHAVDQATAIFPGSVTHLMPRYTDIPEPFRTGATKWNQFQSDWFYSGVNISGLIPKAGIDKNAAIRHLQAINSSFEPKHEHKEAAVAYLASLWFENTSTWKLVK